MKEALEDLNVSIIIVALAIVALGVYMIFQITRGGKSVNDAENIFAPHAVQILGLTFLLPVLLVIAANGKIDAQALTALLGSITGYFFGSSPGRSGQPPRNRINEPAPSAKDDTP